MNTTKKKNTKNEIAVLVTTAHRGVFFGYANPNSIDGEILALRSSRLCIHWTADMKGFMGLALLGPSSSCRIGSRANIRLRHITSVSEVSPAAIVAWEAAP